MSKVDIMLDELENQVLLYRYSIKRDHPEMKEEQLRIMLREKVNRKFKEKNKKVLSNLMRLHLDLLNCVHER